MGKVRRRGSDRQVVWLASNGIDEVKRLLDRARIGEDPPICRHAYKSGPYDIRYRELIVACREAVEPGTDGGVMWMVFAVGRDEHVEVEQDQRSLSRGRPSSRASNRARLDVSSIPGRGPAPPLRTGISRRWPPSSTRENSRWSASSMMRPNVIPRLPALAFAFSRSRSLMVIVVRMMLIMEHQAHPRPCPDDLVAILRSRDSKTPGIARVLCK